MKNPKKKITIDDYREIINTGTPKDWDPDAGRASDFEVIKRRMMFISSRLLDGESFGIRTQAFDYALDKGRILINRVQVSIRRNETNVYHTLLIDISEMSDIVIETSVGIALDQIMTTHENLS